MDNWHKQNASIIEDIGVSNIQLGTLIPKNDPKYLNNPCKYDIYHSPILKPLLDLKQTLYKPSRGDASKIIKQDILLRLDNIEYTQVRTTINKDPK